MHELSSLVVIVYAVVDDALLPDFPLGVELELRIRRRPRRKEGPREQAFSGVERRAGLSISRHRPPVGSMCETEALTASTPCQTRVPSRRAFRFMRSWTQ
jgi:hypothetical protein